MLRPGGWFCLLDFDRPRDPFSWLLGLAVRSFDGWANTADNFAGRLARLIEGAGLDRPEELAREWTPVGPLVYSRAHRSERQNTRRAVNESGERTAEGAHGAANG